MTQDELLRQLDELRSRGRLIFLIGIPLALLLETPIIVYVLKEQFAAPHSRRTVTLPLAGFAACFVIVAVFYLVAQRNIAKRSPLCPLCAGRITWRERASVLASGRCPHCSCELFRDS
jgi:hypothetical protein